MSVLSILTESGNKTAMTESESRSLREAVVLEAKTAMESIDGWKKRYAGLNAKIENVANLSEQYKAATTALVMKNLKEHFATVLKKRGLTEETVAASLGPVAPLTPRVTDIVGIFYPNLIAHLVTDIQVLDRSTGQIFVMRPIYSNTRAGVNAGDEVFVSQTDGTYASEQNFATASVAVAQGASLSAVTIPAATFTGNIQPDTMKVTVRGDDGIGITVAFGNVAADGETISLVNTEAVVTVGGIAQQFTVTGGVPTYTAASNQVAITAIVVTPSDTSTATTLPITLTAEFSALNDYESNPRTIPELEIKFLGVPVQARAHPLRYKVSDQSLFIAQSHLDVDINDEMTTLCAGLIQKERDTLMVRRIRGVATPLPTLNFNANMQGVNYPRDIRWAEIETQADLAINQMIAQNGRGGLSYVIADTYASLVWTKVAGFEANPEAAPSVGPYVAGYFKNGQVPVIVVPGNGLPGGVALGANAGEYIVGYKGFRVGDSAVVLAEWIPLFFTALWDSPNLTNERGLMSLYDLFVNRAQYIYRGSVTGVMLYA